ncbi:glycosyl hydrolase family 8 [Rufibacter roseus]|uniref:cellulase n=1 Tax=Rufibacter roseus TaxID=1567108 RepID=A0ABW2DN88_9BACT|nr:glycosyl hydrolase family 8 [Rufibacter roseus]
MKYYNKLQTMVYTLCCLVTLGSLVSCGKDDGGQSTEPTATQIEVTVKNATSGEKAAGIEVLLFKDPSTQSSGRVPSNALRKVTSDANGVALFNIQTVPNLSTSGTLYTTVLDGSNEVIGSVAVEYKKGETVKKDLPIQPKTNNGGSNPEPGEMLGYKPATITTELAMSEYNRWKTTQVVACGDGLRVIADPAAETKVEAIGFGMLLAAYAQDKTTFDGLHRFYNNKRTPQAANMMAWSVTCSGILDPGSATDGDIDVAFALIVASNKWGSTYLNAAKDILKIISDKLIVSCTVNGKSIYVLAPGYSNVAWGGCNMTDLMYHTPAFFRVFAEVTGNSKWSQLADDTYDLLNAGAHPTTGLVPDWQTASGTPGPGGRAGHFGYDACRAPWRITLDYLWNGNTKAEAWAKKVSNFANGVGPANIKDGYELNGTPRGTNGNNSAFLGGFTVAAMAHSQERVDRFGTELAKLRDNYWFNLNTRVLYLFTLTGLFYEPAV